MHSPCALTELPSQNLARTFLLHAVIQAQLTQLLPKLWRRLTYIIYCWIKRWEEAKVVDIPRNTCQSCRNFWIWEEEALCKLTKQFMRSILSSSATLRNAPVSFLFHISCLCLIFNFVWVVSILLGKSGLAKKWTLPSSFPRLAWFTPSMHFNRGLFLANSLQPSRGKKNW